nr:winged helix-turn-helix transcriptional regulator [Candidatus Sigynarchaeum springense]MDO8118469.1 winged helix-turn-helix transcriptional regulator [Candidatus Sigynarchaeota archaeon]
MKTREKDLSILNELLKNSRNPFIQLSKATNIADTTIHFRVNKLKEQNVIKRFTIELDLDKVGLQYKALIICKIGPHIFEESVNRAKDLVEKLRMDKRIGFLALSEDKKTIIALFVTDNKESFNTILKNFQTNPDIVETQIIYLDSVEKFFIHEI